MSFLLPKTAVAPFVGDIIRNLRQDSPWTITMSPVKSEDSSAIIVTIDSSDDTVTQISFDVWQTMWKDRPVGLYRLRNLKRKSVNE